MRQRVEVRVPTYKRPDWLRESLLSLISQDHEDWIALIFDDDPERSAGQVVSDLSDRRLRYCPNADRMGAAENINQCFESSSLADGDYAFVLEDDNWIHPDFISSNLRCLQTNEVSLMHRNQEIWFRGDGAPVRREGTTLGKLYRPGLLKADEIHAASFLFHGVSNGALFWSTACQSQLRVPNLYPDPSLHEFFRCMAIVEESWFAQEPKAAWADVPKSKTAREYTPNPLFGAYLRTLRKQAWSRGDSGRMRAYLEAAKREGFKGTEDVDLELAYCGIRPLAKTPGAFEKRIRGVMKGAWFGWPLRHATLAAVQGNSPY